jgi:hypothetical protein
MIIKSLEVLSVTESSEVGPIFSSNSSMYQVVADINEITPSGLSAEGRIYLPAHLAAETIFLCEKIKKHFEKEAE